MGLEKVDRFFLFWSLLGLMAAILIWNLPWRFQVNDDEVMMWLVSGAYTGTPESYAVFIHPALSWCFAKLYTIAPDVKWYPVCWFVTMYLGYLGYLKLIWSKSETGLSAQVWSLFALCLVVHFMFFLQFSVVAAFAISAGLANRLDGDSLGSFPVFRVRPTDGLVIMGLLIRPEVLFLFLAAYLVLIGARMGNFRFAKRLVLPVLILVLGYATSQMWIEKSELREFDRINKLRSQVFDHPMLQLYTDEYKVSDPDLYHFANGLMDFGRDSGLVEKLEVWKEKLDDRRGEKFGLGFLVHSFTFYLYHGRFFAMLMLVFFLFVMMSSWRRASGGLALLLVGMLVLSPFYLIKVQIYVLVFLVYFSFCLIHSDQGQKTKIPLLGIFAVLSAMLLVHFNSYVESLENVRTNDLVMQQILEIKEGGIEEVYLIGTGERFTGLGFYNPLNFKKLGWPTLLESATKGRATTVAAYLVDSTTYVENREYFMAEIEMETDLGLVLIVSRP